MMDVLIITSSLNAPGARLLHEAATAQGLTSERLVIGKDFAIPLPNARVVIVRVNAVTYHSIKKLEALTTYKALVSPSVDSIIRSFDKCNASEVFRLHHIPTRRPSLSLSRISLHYAECCFRLL